MSDNKVKRNAGEKGAVLVEAAVSILVFFLFVFGVIEFSYVFFQWNSATKATEWGARLAAVSNPVASNLSGLTGLEPGNILPGAVMPSFDCKCDGKAKACTGTVPANAANCTWDLAAMKTIVLGRGNDGTHCVNGPNGGMCRFYPSISMDNVVIEYQSTGMGYAGRMAGPIPTITVSLQNLTYKFIFLNSLSRLSGITFRASATSTVTGEDLKATWSSS